MTAGWAWRAGPASGLVAPRSLAVTAAAGALALLAVAADTGLGEYRIPLGDVLAVLAGGGSGGQRFVVLDLRLPRAVAGALVGAALALAGAITQTVARNPLAGPDVIGFTAGASAGAVAALVLLDGVPTPVAAGGGALAAAVAVVGLAWRRGIAGAHLVLVGIAVNAILLALVQGLLIVARIDDAARAYAWLVGSLDARTWADVVPLAATLAVLLPVTAVLAPSLAALALGDGTARGLGVRVDGARAALVLVAVGLAAAATACAGPVAFVALVAPQVARRLAGSAVPPLGASPATGAALVVLADLLARTAFGGLPVGVVTAVLGAPVLLALVARRVRA